MIKEDIKEHIEKVEWLYRITQENPDDIDARKCFGELVGVEPKPNINFGNLLRIINKMIDLREGKK